MSLSRTSASRSGVHCVTAVLTSFPKPNMPLFWHANPGAQPHPFATHSRQDSAGHAPPPPAETGARSARTTSRRSASAAERRAIVTRSRGARDEMRQLPFNGQTFYAPIVFHERSTLCETAAIPYVRGHQIARRADSTARRTTRTQPVLTSTSRRRVRDRGSKEGPRHGGGGGSSIALRTALSAPR